MPRHRKNRKSSAVFIVIVGILIMTAAIFVALQNGPAALPTPQVSQSGENTYSNIERVPLENAKTAYDKGQALFVDVRGLSAFAAGRIPGSVLIPLNEFETRWRELDPNDWIITYCT